MCFKGSYYFVNHFTIDFKKVNQAIDAQIVLSENNRI